MSKNLNLINREKCLSSKCAFIIVTYNSKNDIKECIFSIKSFEPNCGIYVVDNNSSDGTKEILDNIEGINLSKLPVNSGFSGGSNLAIKLAIKDNYEYFFLFNPDARLNKKIINSLISISEKENALVGPVIYDFFSNKIQSVGGRFNKLSSDFYISKKLNKSDNNLKKVDWILGAALLVSKRIINECGLLDEEFFPATFEDATYCIKAKERGINSLIDLNSSLIHKGGTSSGGEKNYLFRMIKNRYYFSLKYQNNIFFITSIFLNSLRYIYHKLFGKLKN